MATNRYIGARYVPIFAGDWDNTQEYEPLTIVSYQGDSYTSRGYVPTGIAITNTQYWAKTGDFNQQVANLQSSLQETDGRVQNIEGTVEDLDRDKLDTADFPDMFVTDTVVKEFTVATGMTATGTIAIEKTGYIPIALKGWSTSTFTLRDITVGTSSVSYTVVNNNDSVTTGSLLVSILFVHE